MDTPDTGATPAASPAGAADPPGLVIVGVGFCPCPGRPHAVGDTVFLHERTPLEVGIAAHRAIGEIEDADELAVALGMAYLRFGIAAWTFLEEVRDTPNGPARITVAAITRANISRLLPFDRGGYDVANRAAELYDGAVMGPLVKRLPTPSQPGPTAVSTSPNRASRRARRTRSG